MGVEISKGHARPVSLNISTSPVIFIENPNFRHFVYSHSKLRCRPERLSQITLGCVEVAARTWKLDLDCKLHCEPGKQWLSWSEFKAAT